MKFKSLPCSPTLLPYKWINFSFQPSSQSFPRIFSIQVHSIIRTLRHVSSKYLVYKGWELNPFVKSHYRSYSFHFTFFALLLLLIRCWNWITFFADITRLAPSIEFSGKKRMEYSGELRKLALNVIRNIAYTLLCVVWRSVARSVGLTPTNNYAGKFQLNL